MTEHQSNPPKHQGIAGALAKGFIKSKLTPLLIIASVLLGVLAVALLPREEEPQIKVPMIDVMVAVPGFTAAEIENRVTAPMERLIWEIPGVEYVYSITQPGQALVIVRYLVGEDVERSLVKLNQKLQSNFDRIPPGVSFPLLKPRSIDDVPILAVTFHSSKLDHFALRRIVGELENEVKQVKDVSETTIIGGLRRQLRIQLDPDALAARQLDPLSVIPSIQMANRQSKAGTLIRDNQEIIVETGGFLKDADDVGSVVLGIHNGSPIYLRDVANVIDGPEELSQVVLFGTGQPDGGSQEEDAAITLAVAKRAGTNAIQIADHVLEKIEALRGKLIPSDVEMTITRHYGETAAEKSNELLFHMLIAVVSVALLILISLGWRESIIVALAIPSTLALTLLVFYLTGFTLNRITLFALIFSIGILVDDAIVVVENITRHLHLPENRNRTWAKVAIEAVSEVGNPTILATWAVIAAVFPMAFVGGLMGPYMRPIPIGATAAMLFSLVVAFIVTPWAAVRVLAWGKGKSHASAHASDKEGWSTRIYRRLMGRLIHEKKARHLFMIVNGLLLAGAMGLVAIGWVQVKMLPFDNKNEFQIIINMPEGSSLEQTVQASREIAHAVSGEPEVVDYQIYAGTSAPFNFNGLVRHYFLRRGAHVADIQVNLLPKGERSDQSHDIATRVRPKVAEIAARFNARVAVAEVPPGPPVLQTLVAEIYGPTDLSRTSLVQEVVRVFKSTTGVVDVDVYGEDTRRKLTFDIDHQKAAIHGVTADMISQTLRLAVTGMQVDIAHQPNEREDVQLLVELPRSQKTSVHDILGIMIRPPASGMQSAGRSSLIPLSELVRVEDKTEEKTRYRKNLMPVSYVIGDVAGEVESPVYAILDMNKALDEIDMTRFGGSEQKLQVLNASMPTTTLEPSLKWDGEWHITIEVFRDLGMAFAAVLLLIYILMVGWFQSLLTPLVVMAAIPFSLIGIMPAHGAMGAFFTATSMIGFMAGAGIVIRNSIILVDFIELRLREGMPLDEAVIDAGAVRFRPMLLTAGAVIVGAGIILFDPIFQGLAIALMAGEVASLLISRVAVPVLYYLGNRKKYENPNTAFENQHE
ncbi:MAG: efflux RND transporter permease subunit [bacterium]|nr:efflux RND transporter permease subunit [bacterium]